MKKNITLTLSLVIVCLVLIAYSSEKPTKTIPADLLTTKTWKFIKAESTDERSESVVNALYSDSHYRFQKGNEFQGEFFKFKIKGSWTIENTDDLILNKGTVEEEQFKIAELSANVLKLRTTENGASVTVIYQ